MTIAQRCYLEVADLILIIHTTFVAFVIIGLVLIWTGRCCHWAFVRNFWFRLLHLVAIGFVAAESVAGLECPLTIWEDRLRLTAGSGARYQGSFIQHWLHQVMFFDFSERTFIVAYIVFFLAVALSLWLVPPHWPPRVRAE